MFINDPVVILEEAYKNLYGDNNYELRWDDALDEDGNKVAGYTFFPDDEEELVIALDIDRRVKLLSDDLEKVDIFFRTIPLENGQLLIWSENEDFRFTRFARYER